MAGPRRVLVVDDDEDCRLLVSVRLRSAGYDVNCASGVEAACQRLENTYFDLLVTDLHMPDVNGLGLLGFVQQRRPALPVLILTADHNFTSDMAAHYGAKDVLYKPIEWNKVLAKLAQLG